jgi:hypothetical protein
MLASCYRGRDADERRMNHVLRRQALPPSSESSGKSEFRLTQTASVSGGQPARKMVDAVHERFNIDLHLEVGASRDFAQSAVAQPYRSARLHGDFRPSLDGRHFLDVAHRWRSSIDCRRGGEVGGRRSGPCGRWRDTIRRVCGRTALGECHPIVDLASKRDPSAHSTATMMGGCSRCRYGRVGRDNVLADMGAWATAEPRTRDFARGTRHEACLFLSSAPDRLHAP